MVQRAISSTQANTFAIVIGSSGPVAVEIKLQIYFPGVQPNAEITKEQIHISPIHFSSSATIAEWRRVARLARIAVPESEILQLCTELNSILSFVSVISSANVDEVEPMTSVTPMPMKMRSDEVTEGGIADDIMANAPEREDHFFVVPKVVE